MKGLLFGCRWDNLGSQEWMFGNENVPKWVHKKTLGMKPGTISQFKGKTFVYKVIRHSHSQYGITPATFYRRLRYKK